MREGWEIKSLPDCLDKTPRVTKIPKKHFKSHGKYPIVSQEKGLINGYWDDESDLVQVDQPLVVFGDHTQVVKLVDFSFVIGADGVKLLKPKAFLNPRYFYYFLIGHPLKALGYARHFRLLKEVDVAVPPLPEQKRIVAILDEAFAGIDTAIANTEKSLANVRELFHSYIHSWFNVRPAAWPQRNLEALTDVQSGGTPLKSKKEYWGGKVPWYSSGELNRLHTVEPKDCITALGVKESNAKVFPPGSLLVGMYDTAAMKMSILDREAAFNQAIAGLRPTENLDLRFVMFALNAMKPAILGLRRGVRQKNLSLRKIKDIQIPVPALKEQTHVAEQILGFKQEISHLELIHQRKMNALVELKQSLLQKAFSGELTADRAEQEVESATA